MPADLFAALERVLAKYRRDVHQLSLGASAEAVSSLEAHLRRPLPEDWWRFLLRANGATLFRGALRIRSAAEVALASDHAPQVVLFADASTGQRWGWAAASGRWVFGLWTGEELVPSYGSFSGWLNGEIALLDTGVTRVEDQEALRLEADPDDAFQLVSIGERLLRSGQPEQAESILRRATELAPHHIGAWQRLGDALAITDRSAARMAWYEAFRGIRFPLAWPGAPCIDPEMIRPLQAAFQEITLYERELSKFLEDQVRDVLRPLELRVVVVVGTELAKSLIRRGRRSDARSVLSDLLARCRSFSFRETPWEAVLELARVEFDLGHHDEAEAVLRRIRKEAPSPWQGPGLLLLGRLAIARQEPWAEEILDEAVQLGLDETDRVEAATLRCERAVRQEHKEEAKHWLEMAHGLAQRVAVRSLQALVYLAEADVERLFGQRTLMRDALKKGLALLAERDDPETRFRLLLRLGDVSFEEGKTDEAFRLYQQAAEGFTAHELPLREGWAALRLARVARDPRPLLTLARERFSQADLGAGMAAVDAFVGDPGASLPWHLGRASAQARARHDAQRARPPWDRSDADRPERRLGAHRLAIAACTEAIVRDIERELEACARAISTGRGRALDPPVMAYIAAIDLLSAHRSYAAAQVLLRHLLTGNIEGAALRALQGAIARSANAALVDGLLSCVENAQQFTADAVAAATEILGLRRERAATLPLLALAAPKSNPMSRKAAIVALGRIGDRTVVDRIEPSLEEPKLAEHAALALLLLGDRRGVDFHGRALAEDRRDLIGSPGEIVGRYGGPSYLLLLVRTAEGEGERALGAAQGLGLMGDLRAVPTLLKALSSKDRRMIEMAAGSLTILTGHSEDINESGLRARWTLWWEAHGERLGEGIRYRDGQRFEPSLLIDKMEHDDPWIRRTAYDELVITTGCSLPFDSEGPWRMQRVHVRAWRDWWTKSRSRLVAGQWYLDGKVIQ